MITSTEICVAIDDALRQFGEYSYHDKGASEVMDIPYFSKCLIAINDADKIIKVLTEVQDSHRDPEPFLTDVIFDMQNWDSPEADKFFDSPFVARYY